VRGFRAHADNCLLSPKPIRPLELIAPVTRDVFQGTEILFVSASPAVVRGGPAGKSRSESFLGRSGRSLPGGIIL
jgi:hypothetical protein